MARLHRGDGAFRRASLVTGMTLLALTPLAAITYANRATGVSAEKLHQTTFEAFKVKTGAESPLAMQLKSRTPADLVLRRHTYQPGGSTGWHRHDGPVFVLVTKGTLTRYDFHDPECRGVDVPAGKGFVDDGHGHLVRNERAETAEDVSVIMTTVGANVFRSELKPQDSPCDFG